ncbi:MAG: phage tail protein [Planctomycetes bacterium]|jgi:phage tail-like protein|nr:phage tail protein [Planctomycetota bacterium]
MKARFLVFLVLVAAGAAAGLPAGVEAAPAPRFSVRLDLDGIPVARFAEIRGGGATVEIVEYRDGDDPVVRKRPGKVKFNNITLERGVVSDPSLLDWFRKGLSGTTERKSGSIIYLDREGNEVLRLNFSEAWPAGFEAGPFTDGAPVIESFELGMEKLERVTPAAPLGRFAAARGFSVQIDGASAGGVVSASPIGVTHAPAADGDPATIHARNLTLACATGLDEGLHAWFAELAAGKDIRKSITVNLRAAKGEPGRTYVLHECWPCRWKAPELNSNSDTFIVEELEFAVERVERG